MRADDLARLAALHTATLPVSIVAMLGDGFARAFYRYVMRSQQEIVVTTRAADGRLLGAGVVSLSPATLKRRLIVHTSLAVHLLGHPRLTLRALRDMAVEAIRPPREDVILDPAVPELLLLFTDPDVRSQGLGSALLHDAEARLVARGVRRYLVKTEAAPSNRALRFYRERGFRPLGTIMWMDVEFEVLERTLDG